MSGVAGYGRRRLQLIGGVLGGSVGWRNALRPGIMSGDEFGHGERSHWYGN